MTDIVIYTDGSCIGNGSANARGGWAWCMVIDGELTWEDYGTVSDTTNNRMELLAVIKALEDTSGDIKIISDSNYVVKGITEWINGWKKRQWKKVKNVDLWKRLDTLTTGRTIKWKHVYGHTGNVFNEHVDKRARVCATANC